MISAEKVLIIDAEFVDNQEVIQLSVWNLAEREVFHSYFKPRRIKRWPDTQAVHHISPEDVKDSPFFSDLKTKMQRIFDQADYIVGFAVDGDIRHLEDMGLKGLSRKRIIEVKDFFWHYIGRHEEIDYYGVPGLEKCADRVGVTFGGEGAHSAREDAKVTLLTLRAIIADSEKNAEGVEKNYSDQGLEWFERGLKDFDASYPQVKDDYERSRAAGRILVKRVGEGLYRVSYKRSEIRDPEKFTVVKEVEDMLLADQELSERFFRKREPGRKDIYRLSDKDLRYIASYTNTYESGGDRRMARKLLQLSKAFR